MTPKKGWLVVRSPIEPYSEDLTLPHKFAETVDEMMSRKEAAK